MVDNASEKIITIHEVCELLCLKTIAVRRLYKAGKFPVLRYGKTSLRFKESDIIKYRESTLGTFTE